MPAFDAETRRAFELDTFAAMFPEERRDQLAKILTDDDVATLKHLAKEGMGANSLRALTSDLAYLEAWSLAATQSSLPWPAIPTGAFGELSSRQHFPTPRLWTAVAGHLHRHEPSFPSE